MYIRYDLKLHWKYVSAEGLCKMGAAFILTCPSIVLRIPSLVWSSLFYEHKTALLMQCVELIRDVLFPGISSISNAIPFAE